MKLLSFFLIILTTVGCSLMETQIENRGLAQQNTENAQFKLVEGDNTCSEAFSLEQGNDEIVFYHLSQPDLKAGETPGRTIFKSFSSPNQGLVKYRNGTYRFGNRRVEGYEEGTTTFDMETFEIVQIFKFCTSAFFVIKSCDDYRDAKFYKNGDYFIWEETNHLSNKSESCRYRLMK